MWLTCQRAERFWSEVIKWLESITKEKIIPNEALPLFSLFTRGNEYTVNKELIEIILGGDQNEITHQWKDAQDLALQTTQNRIWRLSLMEKLTYCI